jgi:hypothetical protein
MLEHWSLAHRVLRYHAKYPVFLLSATGRQPGVHPADALKPELWTPILSGSHVRNVKIGVPRRAVS